MQEKRAGCKDRTETLPRENRHGEKGQRGGIKNDVRDDFDAGSRRVGHLSVEDKKSKKSESWGDKRAKPARLRTMMNGKRQARYWTGAVKKGRDLLLGDGRAS